MATIGTLTADLTLRSASFMKNMERASQATQRHTAQMKKSMRQVESASRNLNRQVGQLRAGVAALAGVLAVRQFGQFTKAAIANADAVQKTADKLGIGAKALQQYRVAAELTGVAQNTLDMGLQRFIRRVGEAAQGSGELRKILERYNIAVTDSEGRMRRTRDVLLDLSDAMANAGSAQERLVIAFKAFDSEGAALVNTFGKGRAAVEAFMDQAVDLGLVYDKATLQLAEQTQDRMSLLRRSFQVGFSTSIIRTFSKALDGSTEQIQEAGRIGRQLGAVIGEAMRGIAEAAIFAARNVRELAAGFAFLAGLKIATVLVSVAVATARLTKALIVAARAGAVLNVVMGKNVLGALAKLGLAIAAGAAAWEALGKDAKAAMDRIEKAADDMLGTVNPAFEQTADQIDSVIESLIRENAQMALLRRAHKEGAEAVERANETIAVQNALLGAGIKVTLEQAAALGTEGEAAEGTAGEIAELVRLREEQAAKLEKLTGAQGETTKATDEATDAARRQQERLEDFRAQPFLNALEDIQRTLTDTFEDAFAGNLDSLSDWTDSFRSIVNRLVANLASQQIVLPLVATAAAGIGISPEALGVPPEVLGGIGSPPGSQSVGGGLLGGLQQLSGSVFGQGGFGGFLNNTVGPALGFAPAPAAGGSIGVGLGPPSLAQQAAGAPLFGATTFGQFMGGVGSGFAAGTLLNSLVGGNQTGGTIGSAGGAVAGAIIGSLIAPGIGTLIGGLLGGAGGGLLGGSLIGNNDSPNVTQTTRFGVAEGIPFLRDTLTDDVEDIGAARAQSRQIADQLNQFRRLVGGTFTEIPFEIISNFNDEVGTFLAGGGVGRFPGVRVSEQANDLTAVFKAMIEGVEPRGGGEDVRLFEARNQFIADEAARIFGKTEDVQTAFQALEFLQNTLGDMDEPITETERALEEFRGQLGLFSEEARDRIREALAEDFVEELDQMLVPQSQFLDNLEQMSDRFEQLKLVAGEFGVEAGEVTSRMQTAVQELADARNLAFMQTATGISGGLLEARGFGRAAQAQQIALQRRQQREQLDDTLLQLGVGEATAQALRNQLEATFDVQDVNRRRGLINARQGAFTDIAARLQRAQGNELEAQLLTFDENARQQVTAFIERMKNLGVTADEASTLMAQLETSLGLERQQIIEDYNDRIIEEERRAKEAQLRIAKDLRDFLDQQLLGDLSTLSPRQQVEEARRQFEETLQQARGGDLTAAEDLTGIGERFLRVGRDFFASSGGFAAIESDVRAGIASVADMLESTAAVDGQASNNGGLPPALLRIFDSFNPENVVAPPPGSGVIPPDMPRELRELLRDIGLTELPSPGEPPAPGDFGQPGPGDQGQPSPDDLIATKLDELREVMERVEARVIDVRSLLTAGGSDGIGRLINHIDVLGGHVQSVSGHVVAGFAAANDNLVNGLGATLQGISTTNTILVDSFAVSNTIAADTNAWLSRIFSRLGRMEGNIVHLGANSLRSVRFATLSVRDRVAASVAATNSMHESLVAGFGAANDNLVNGLGVLLRGISATNTILVDAFRVGNTISANGNALTADTNRHLVAQSQIIATAFNDVQAPRLDRIGDGIDSLSDTFVDVVGEQTDTLHADSEALRQEIVALRREIERQNDESGIDQATAA